MKMDRPRAGVNCKDDWRKDDMMINDDHHRGGRQGCPMGSMGASWVLGVPGGRGGHLMGQGGRQVYPIGSKGRQGCHGGKRRTSIRSQGVKGGVRGVPGGQRRHLMGPLIIYRALQVSLRIQRGRGACLGVQLGREGPSGGTRGSVNTSWGSPGAVELL